MFGLPVTPHPQLLEIRKQLTLLQKLYGLYNNVIETVNGYYDILWADIHIERINNELLDFQTRSVWNNITQFCTCYLYKMKAVRRGQPPGKYADVRDRTTSSSGIRAVCQLWRCYSGLSAFYTVLKERWPVFFRHRLTDCSTLYCFTLDITYSLLHILQY